MSESITTVTSEQTAKRTSNKAKRDTNSVSALLDSLRKAAARGDASAGKKIRRKLRKAGHYGGLRERETSDVRVTGKRKASAKRSAKSSSTPTAKRTRTSSAKRTPNVASETAATSVPDTIVEHDSNGTA